LILLLTTAIDVVVGSAAPYAIGIIQPKTKNQQPTTNNKQQTTNNQQPTTNNQQPTTNN